MDLFISLNCKKEKSCAKNYLLPSFITKCQLRSFISQFSLFVHLHILLSQFILIFSFFIFHTSDFFSQNCEKIVTIVIYKCRIGSRFFIIRHIHNHTSITSSEMQVELKRNTA